MDANIDITALYKEMVEMNREMIEMKYMFRLLLPKSYTIGYLMQITGRSRQAIRTWMIRNTEPDVDYWEKKGKIYISEQAALKYISERRSR